jgi:hypothetical protein
VPARIIGVVLLLPIPLFFAGGFLLGMILAVQGKNPDAIKKDALAFGAILEIGILLTGFRPFGARRASG